MGPSCLSVRNMACCRFGSRLVKPDPLAFQRALRRATTIEAGGGSEIVMAKDSFPRRQVLTNWPVGVDLGCDLALARRGRIGCLPGASRALCGNYVLSNAPKMILGVDEKSIHEAVAALSGSRMAASATGTTRPWDIPAPGGPVDRDWLDWPAHLARWRPRRG